ncbi:MAG: hypothetical protein ABID04_02110 [Patescibacteria group bacterium]
MSEVSVGPKEVGLTQADMGQPEPVGVEGGSFRGLREFRERPDGYVSVFLQVKRKRLETIAFEGARPSGRMAAISPEVEEIFELARDDRIPVSRTNCIFAYPFHPDDLKQQATLSFNPREEVMLELLVDPKSVFVVNADLYGEANWAFRSYAKKDVAEKVEGCAEQYWEDAVRLDEYLATGIEPEEEISFLEVLIGSDIPPERIRIAPERPPAEDSEDGWWGDVMEDETG